MKSFVRHFVLATPVLLFGFLALPVSAQITIAPKAVEDAVRAAAKKNTGDLTESDLAKVTELDLSGMELTTLTLPEGMVNLETLDLSNNQLAGTLFSPLKMPDELPKLKVLNLSNNVIGGLSFLENYTALEELNLAFNDKNKLTLPEGLGNLTSLDITGNNMTQLVLPGDLSKITSLSFNRNKIEVLTIPTGMESLELIDLRSNGTTEIILPPDLVNLKKIEATNNALESITIPPGLNALEEVLAFNNNIKTVSIAPNLPALETFDVFGNEIEHITFPAGLDALATIDLKDNDDLKTVTVPPSLAVSFQSYFSRLEGVEIIIQVPAPTISVPELVQVSKKKREARVTLSGDPGDYVVYASLDLETWEKLADVTIGENGADKVVKDSSATDNTFSYYRAEALIPDLSEDDF